MASQFDFLLSQVRTNETALIGGTVTFYAAGTTTLKNVYLDPFQITTAANPYTLSADATAQLYGAGQYRIVIKDAAGVTQFDYDDVTSGGEEGNFIALDASVTATASLPSGGIVSYAKTDASATAITITPSVGGQTFAGGLTSYTISNQGETVRFSLSGTVWYTI